MTSVRMDGKVGSQLSTIPPWTTRTLQIRDSSQTQPASILTPAAAAAAPARVHPPRQGPAVRTELVELPPRPEGQREDHGHAEHYRRDRKAVCHGPMLALNAGS